MPRPRKPSKPRSAQPKSPVVKHPPQPPKWTLRAYDFQPGSNSITIVMESDTPNELTLAWTYGFPFLQPKQTLAPRFIRNHHFDYDLRNLNFTHQVETPPSINHTFVLYPAPGCHDIYMAAFDGRDPTKRHSISPVIALTYCSDAQVPPTGIYYQSNFGIPLVPGADQLFLATYNFGGPQVPLLTATGAIVNTLLAPDTYIGHAWSHFGGTWHIDTTFHASWAFYWVIPTDPNPVFNQLAAGHLITGLPNPATLAVAINSASPPFNTVTGRSEGTFTFPNDAVSGELQLGLDASVGYPTDETDNWSDLPVPFFVLGPYAGWSYDGVAFAQDGVFTVIQLRIPLAGAITSFEDITPIWRRRVPLPQP